MGLPRASRLRLAIPTLLLMLFPAWNAFARAGGGEHFQSGGDSGPGGGWDGGGGDIGDLIRLVYLLVRLHIAYPRAMLVVWIVAILLFWLYSRSTPRATTKAAYQRIERRRMVPSENLSAAIAALHTRDPGFDPAAFLARTEKAFLDIQEAWFRRRLDAVRHLMSDGTYRRFTTLLGLMQDEGRRDALADCRVVSRRILELEHTDAFDIVSVRIDASMRDTDVPAGTDDEAARARARAARAEEFTELWTFARRPGVQSRTGYDLGQGQCPNCGAPFEGGAANTCTYCKAIVNSGNYDWVLTEITQPSEYLPRRRLPAGLDALYAKDPDAAPEILEDRALLLFWKWLEARASGRPQVLRKLATARGFEAVSGLNASRRLRVRTPAVGGADVIAVETGADGFDRVHVDLRWSASISHDSSGAPVQPRRHVLVMVRAADAKTDRGAGLSTERCGNCNAPLTDSDSTSCDYCGHDLAGASREWQFEELVPREHWRRPSEVAAPSQRPLRAEADLHAFYTPAERQRLLLLLAALARADGEVSGAERRMLRAHATRWQVPWGPVEAVLRGTRSGDPFAPLPPQSPEAAEQLVATLVAMARVDGRVDRRERFVILAAAKHLNVSPETVGRLLGEVS